MAKARTAKQRAALRKAQLASARKRKGKGKKNSSAARKRGKRNALIVAGIAGAYYGWALGYVYKVRKNQRNLNAEYADAMNEWSRRQSNYNKWKKSQARYSNAGPTQPTRPRFVPSTRGPGSPLNPRKAIGGFQRALPRGRS